MQIIKETCDELELAEVKKKRTFFAPFILFEEVFFNVCVLFQCIVYGIHFQNIHTLTYHKALLHTLFCLFLKSWKAFSVSLNTILKPDPHIPKKMYYLLDEECFLFHLQTYFHSQDI